MQHRLVCFLSCILLALASQSQNLNGIWRGKLTQDPGGCYPVYYLELQISAIDANNISGNSYDFYDKSRFVRLDFNGRYNAQTKRLVIIESKVLTFQIPHDCVPCIKTYDLNYTNNGKDEFLTGDWKGFEAERRGVCPPGKITLQRVMQSEFPVIIRQNDTLAKIQQTLKLKPREKDLVKTLLLDTSEVRIDLYDNAEIDDDTITVFLNNTLLLYQKRLTDKPLTLTLHAFPGTEYELMMYADNLGRIPPNTALMVITAGEKKYELRMVSTEQKTATVRFVYQPTKSQ
jgi:hypothetical protein